MTNNVLGLGLESSCDETSASIVRNGKTILSNTVFSQIEIHRDFYGVVPEIASRAHLEIINPIIETAMNEAGVDFNDIDYVAVTNRPGLVGSLLVSLQSAKALSFSLGIPVIGVNHLEAHLYAPYLEGNEPGFPFIGLLISGGNTVMYIVRDFGDMEVLGKTADDAAGEAFDKIAKYLDIGYPGGPAIEKLATTAVRKNLYLPKILAGSHDYRFSFSGIKTAVAVLYRNEPGVDKAELVYAFQERVLEILVRRLFAASRRTGIRRMVVAGGVACSMRLRELIDNAKDDDDVILFPSSSLCTDNAAMVAGLGFQYFARGIYDDLNLDVYARVK